MYLKLIRPLNIKKLGRLTKNYVKKSELFAILTNNNFFTKLTTDHSLNALVANLLLYHLEDSQVERRSRVRVLAEKATEVLKFGLKLKPIVHETGNRCQCYKTYLLVNTEASLL